MVGDLAERVYGVAERMSDVFQVPVLGRIAAGTPIPVPEAEFSPFGYEKSVDLTRDIVKDVKGIYALEVQGDSMIDEGIHNGDHVVIEERGSAENGETVIALLPGGEVTLKRYFREGKIIRLQPANDSLRPMMIPEEDLRIQGVVIGVLRRYRRRVI